jgi:DNA-binding NarL/FixJ family response regulator
VVVADDSPLYRQSLARAVRARSELHLIAAVETGEAAVAAVEALTPDVLVVDLRMPGLDGLDVLERLADHELVKVLVSASLDADVEREARAAGANACLPKALSCGEICTAALALAQR